LKFSSFRNCLNQNQQISDHSSFAQISICPEYPSVWESFCENLILIYQSLLIWNYLKLIFRQDWSTVDTWSL